MSHEAAVMLVPGSTDDLSWIAADVAGRLIAVAGDPAEVARERTYMQMALKGRLDPHMRAKRKRFQAMWRKATRIERAAE